MEDVISEIPKNLESIASIKEEIQEPDSPIKEDSLYTLIGGEQSFQKLDEIFKQKIHSDDCEESIKKL